MEWFAEALREAKQVRGCKGYPVILGGDHAAFEIEHANTPSQQRPDWPLPSFDALDWAKAFCKTFIVSRIEGHLTAPVDDQEGLMTTWFANALMRGFDQRCAREFEFHIKREREACAQVALCIGEDAGAAIAAAIRLRKDDG